jgi:hypothetical protein
MEWLSKILDEAGKSLKIAAVAFIVSAALLSFPARLKDFLGLQAIASTYKAYISIVLLISGALIFVELGNKAYRAIETRVSARRKETAIKERFFHLTSLEAAIIREFLFGDRVTMLPVDDPSVSSLREDDILERVGTVETRIKIMRFERLFFHFRLARIAESNLTPTAIGVDHILDTELGGEQTRGIRHWHFTKEGIQWIKENRPPFARQYQGNRGNKSQAQIPAQST